MISESVVQHTSITVVDEKPTFGRSADDSLLEQPKTSVMWMDEYESAFCAKVTAETRAQSRYLRNRHKHNIDVLQLEQLCAGGRR